MLVLTVLILIVAIPVFVHYWTFDIATGSAASALIFGLVCGLLALFREGAAQGTLAFFLATFVGFGLAYVVGLIYQSLGAEERRSFQTLLASAPPSRRRQALGAFGALAIPSTLFGVWALDRWQTGEWSSIPTEPALGFLAFFVFGIAALIKLYVSRQKK
jgi:hypothetical protein